MLQIISSSPGELEPVFQAMLDNPATRICDAKFGIMFEFADARLLFVVGIPPDFADYV